MAKVEFDMQMMTFYFTDKRCVNQVVHLDVSFNVISCVYRINDERC